MIKKGVGILIILSFIIMNVAITYVPAFAKEETQNINIDLGSEKAESESEKEELRIVELEEFLVSPLVLLFASDRSGINVYPINTRLNTKPYFCLPYPPPNF